MQGGAPGLQGDGVGGQGAAHAADEGGVAIGQGQRRGQVAPQGQAGEQQGGEGIAGTDGVDHARLDDAGALGQHSPDLVEGGVDLGQVNPEEGTKIVQNIFGGNTEQVAHTLGGSLQGQTGLVQRLLPILAPIVLSYLAKRIGGQSSAGGGGLADVLGGISGVRVIADNGTTDVQIRSSMTNVFRPGGPQLCLPLVFVDGLVMADAKMPGPGRMNLEQIRPQDVAGIEIYGEAGTPLQYARGGGQCGAVLFWTRSGPSPR